MNNVPLANIVLRPESDLKLSREFSTEPADTIAHLPADVASCLPTGLKINPYFPAISDDGAVEWRLSVGNRLVMNGRYALMAVDRNMAQLLARAMYALGPYGLNDLLNAIARYPAAGSVDHVTVEYSRPEAASIEPAFNKLEL